MRDSWLKLVDAVLRPARRHLDRCLRERDEHLVRRRAFTEERARALASCEERIERARAAVFAANDGVITSQMTDLEREWRMLARPDPDRGLMDLWARIAPPSWIDRKRWRDSPAAAQLDATIALAADVEGVEAAESAIGALRTALAPWALALPSRIRWRMLEHDSDVASEVLAEPLRTALAVVAAGDAATIVLERACRLEDAVHGAARARFPERGRLARALAQAAFVDCVWRAAALGDRANPVTPLREIWSAGYLLSAFDAGGMILELPPLAQP